MEKRSNNREEIKKNTLDKSVSKYISSSTCGLILVVALALYLARNRLPQRFLEGFLVGSMAGLANLVFLSMTIKAIVNTEGANKRGAMIGFLGINVSLFALLFPAYMQWVNIPALATGFTVVLGMLLVGTYSVIKRKG
jgi:hypothetical protein